MFPSKVKNITLFNAGQNYLGTIVDYTPIKLSMATDDFRGGGMLGPVAIDRGLEKLEFEWTLGGWSNQVVGQFGVTQLDGVPLRAMGALQSDDTGAVTAVEAVILGRHTEIDFGTWKPGGDTEKKIKTAASYYQLTVGGVTQIEIDMLAGVYIVGGVDRYAAIREALGG